MKKVIINILSILAVASMATGCIKETVPQGSTLTAGQLSAKSSALATMVAGIPAAMMTSDYAGYLSNYNAHTDFGLPAVHLMTEYMLEDLATLGANPYYNRFYAQCLNQYQGSRYIYCAYFWTCYYSWIKAANDVIRLINEETADEATLKVLGHAYAYRAYCYLDLARMFEPKEPGVAYAGYDLTKVKGLTVPKVTETTTEKEAGNNPRLPHDKMYEFILADLTKADSLLLGSNDGYSLPSEHAVDGLFARAYLEMGAYCKENGDAPNAAIYYDKAVEHAKKVIDSNDYSPLTQDQWEDPANGFNNGSANDSWIWGLRVADENVENIICFTAHIASEGQWGYAPLAQIGINKALYDRIPDSDFRKHSWLDPSFENYYAYKFAGSAKDKSIFLNGDKELGQPKAKAYQNIKFRPKGGICDDYASGNSTDHMLMRIEEMYFIAAEASAMTGKFAVAQKYLGDLIKTRNPDYDCSGFGTESSFIKEMMLQKRIEFWGEGVLFFDYKRLGLGITRGYSGTNHAAVYAYNSTGRSPQWNFVITRSEFQANKGIGDDDNNPDPSNLLELWSE